MTRPVSAADEAELVAKMQAAAQERQELVQRLELVNAYLLRLEGALAFVRGKLSDDEEAVQAAGEAAEPAGVSEGEARQG